MKKLSICMLAAAVLFTSCNFFVTPEDSKKDKEDVKPELPAPTDFEYTAKNDVPADQAPFDEKLCNKTADSLKLSDGDWTIVEINQSFNTYSKIIAKVGVTDSNLTYKSGIVKLDVESESIDEEDDTPVYYDESNLKTSFDTIKDFYLGPISEYSTFSNGYLIGDDKTIYIASIKLDSLKSYFESKIKDKAIKSNTAKNKYFIKAEGPSIFPSFIYIYKDANLNDEELNSETPEVTQPEITNPENSEEPQNPPTESEESSGNQNKPETDLKKIYTKDNDVPADKAPFDKSSCPVTGKTPVFSNGNWKIVDIAKGTIYNTKVITDVSYTGDNYNCSSIVCKYDFPREGASEVDYEELYKGKILPYDNYDDGLSHGYLTDDKIVLIAKNKTSEFKEIYLAQLNAVSKYPEYIYSNKEGTKYIIPYEGNGYLQTIYIYKEPLEDDSEADDDLGYTAPTLPESVGTDPFKGKTFANDYDKYVFGNDGTFTYYANMGENAYTYNANTRLLTRRYIAVPNHNGELVPFEEYKQTIIIMVNQEMKNASDEAKEAAVKSMISMTKKEFEKTSVYKAELVDGNLALQTDYFTAVPDVKDIFLNGVSFKNNLGFEMILNIFGESRKSQTGSLGTINFYITRTYDTSTEGMQSSTSRTSTESFDITEITDTQINASGEVEIFWDGNHRKEKWNLSFTYNVTCNSDGTLTFTISGNDDVTKAELGATESNSNPSYQLRSKGASILEPVTK